MPRVCPVGTPCFSFTSTHHMYGYFLRSSAWGSRHRGLPLRLRHTSIYSVSLLSIMMGCVTKYACIDAVELYITLAFDVEIVWRVLGHLPDWRLFFHSKRNVLDLFLALSSSIIQIPPIHRGRVYPWLTFFQLARFYRVIVAVPGMRPLLVIVFFIRL